MLNRTPILVAANSLILLLWFFMRKNQSNLQPENSNSLGHADQIRSEWSVIGPDLHVHIQKPYVRRSFDQTAQKEAIKLSYTEHKLLRFLLTRGAKPQSIEDLFIHVWSARETTNDRLRDEQKESVRRLVYQLRQKCEANPSTPQYICTVHGYGYRFDQDTSYERNLHHV